MKKRIILAIVVVIGIVLDQISKILTSGLMFTGQRIELIPGVLRLTYIRNEGAAFGMLSEHRWIFMVISTIAIVGIGIYLFGFCKERMTLKVGLALIVSGGIGNMIDRIAYGYVVDMIDFYLFDWWHWIFNIADAFVCIGAGAVVLALVLDLFKDMKKKKQKNEDKQ